MAEAETRVVGPLPALKQSHGGKLVPLAEASRPVSVHGARQTSSVRAAAGLMVDTATPVRSTGNQAAHHASSSIKGLQAQAGNQTAHHASSLVGFFVQGLDHHKPDAPLQPIPDASSSEEVIPPYRSKANVGGRSSRQPNLPDIIDRPGTEQQRRRPKRGVGKENSKENVVSTTVVLRPQSPSSQQPSTLQTPSEILLGEKHPEPCSGQCCVSVAAQHRVQELERLLLVESKNLASARKAEAAAVRAREFEQAERRKAQDEVDALRRALEAEKQRSKDALEDAKEEFRWRQEQAEEQHVKEKEAIREKHAKDIGFLEASLEKVRGERTEAIHDATNARQLLAASRTRAQQLEQEVQKST